MKIPSTASASLRSVVIVAVVALGTWVSIAGASGPADTFDPYAAARGEERLRAVREALPVDPPLPRPDGLARRAPLTSLSVLVIGCDFADSLMYGRDLDDFPGWPEQTRTSQRIPPAFPGDPIGGTPMFTAHDSTYFDLQMQRVDDYFRTVSFDRFELDWDVYGSIVNLPETMGYYGDDDSTSVRAVRMARQVIDAVDDDVDFSLYDTLVLVHAGAGQETDLNGDSPDQISSNYLDARDFERAVEAGALPEPFLATGEAPVEHVLILPEAQAQDPPTGNGFGGFFDVRGVYAFEFGLRMGMLSLADFTPGFFPDSQGIGNFGLMGYGLFTGLGTVPSAPCAMNRYLMGWVDAVDVRADADVRIGAMDAVGAAVSDTLLVRVPITDREYWLLEYRLQDPDGDLFYTFAGKEPEDGGNGNNLPDYFDADSTNGDGTPTSPYDPATDTWEDELGAEWDWFMSENAARTRDGCQRAGGSGLYVWHIDERVIQDAILVGTNTINADATRKGVDVEEADGIQDLDSLRGGLYLLGGDDDAWRGEGNAVFGPDTLPSTTSNDGFPTGIRLSAMSDVVLDSLPKFEFQGSLFCSGFVYAPAMTLRIDFDVDADPDGPTEIGRVRTTDFAPTADLRAGDFFGAGGVGESDGAAELIAAADDGRLLIWQDGTTPWNGTDAEFHRASGERIVGPPVFQRRGLSADPAIGIVTTASPALVYLTRAGEVALNDMTTAFDGPPITGPFGSLTGFAEDDLRWVRATDTGFVLEELRAFEGPDPTSSTSAVVGERIDDAISHSSLEGGVVAVRVDSTETTLTSFNPAGVLLRRVTVDGGYATNSLTPLDVEVVIANPAVGWVGTDGRVRLAGVRADGARLDRASLEAGLPASSLATTRVTEDGPSVVAVSLGGDLHVFDANLRSLPGFPYRIERGGVDGVVGSRAAAPVLVDLTGDGRVEVIWHEPAGTVHAVDLEGRTLPGWPVAGPSEPISSPVVADLDGDGDLDLAVAGRFGNVVAIDAPGREVERRIQGEIRVYDLDVPASAYAPWPQAGGDAGARVLPGNVVRAGSVGEDPGLLVYPNPTIDGRARIRYRVPRAGTFTLTIYTLEGQEVLATDPVRVPAGTFFEEEVDLGGATSGMYLCRVSGDGVDERGVLTVVR